MRLPWLNRWLERHENGHVIHYPYAQPEAQQIRQGWICGDGTGIGKGRQIAGIIVDNWLQGRKKAVWITVSAGLIEASRRDWQDLGGQGEQIVSLNKFKPNQKIDLESGILFLTYSTLRQPATEKNQSRLEQIVEWLGDDFEGLICFDECHGMGGAASSQGERGLTKASKQGLAGLKLQHLLPNARVIYVSATGASKISNLAYAERLGLWGTTESAFKDRNQFFEEIGSSGLAALEIVSRELKARGLYLARSLSFVGVNYETLIHELTPEQIEIFDSYAHAFKIIHQNIHAALAASGGKGSGSSTYSVFESTKQRFFNQLLISLSCVSLIAAIERDLAAGYAPVLQIVSTNEAMLERTLADIPPKEWGDLKIDISPKSYILDYLNKSFPIHLMEEIEVEGNLITTFALDKEGNKIVNQEALQIREATILTLINLPPVHSVLDQIIFYFGTDKVAEISGRSQRLVKIIDEAGQSKIAVKERKSGSNLAEQEAFNSDRKQILFFSKAGGTGFDFHASKNIKNQRLRRHYLVEAGWNAAQAVQGFGRTNRSNQLQPPVYILLTTNVLGQKRFTSSIASRLSSLGAITKGQAQTGSNGLFKAEDDLNNRYAQAALDRLIADIYHRNLPQYSFEQLEANTGLTLSSEGKLITAPRINKFLNRLLAMKVEEQNYLFSELERRIQDNIAEAKEAGHYETGMESVRADSIILDSQVELWQDPESKAKTIANKIVQKNRLDYLSPSQAIAKVNNYLTCKLLYNQKSQNVCYTAPSWGVSDAKTGEHINYFNLCFPDATRRISAPDLERSNWIEIDESEFA
ncbi:MAG: strawberry notch family protein, partial [Waterburya sp.]